MLVEILFGPIGSGKSTYCKQFLNACIISQDEMGRKGHIKAFKRALTEKQPYICIDRMNFNREQRRRYIQPALLAGYQVKITTLCVTYDECLERVLARENHPTIAKGDEVTARRVLDFFFANMEYPLDSEISLAIEKST